MLKLIRRNSRALLASLLIASVLPVSADVIYDNSVNDLKLRLNPGTTEVGDEIIFGSSARYLTNFAFEWYGINTSTPGSFQGNVQARVRFYENSGSLFSGYAQPASTPFYDTDWFNLPFTTERSTFTFTVENLYLPVGGLLLPASTNMTWTVQFQGMQGADEAGVDLYSAPVVGQNYTDFWERTESGWILKTNPQGKADFAARFFASPVPEPRTWMLSLLGGLGLLSLVSRRK